MINISQIKIEIDAEYLIYDDEAIGSCASEG